MTSLPGHLWSHGHVMSFPVMSLPPPANYSPVGAQTSQNLTYRPFRGTPRWLPVKQCNFQVTSGHVRSRDVISCHVTATPCGLQPRRSSNIPKTWLTGLVQPLAGYFLSNDVTSGSLLVTRACVTSFPVTWLPSPASYSPVGTQTSPKLYL